MFLGRYADSVDARAGRCAEDRIQTAGVKPSRTAHRTAAVGIRCAATRRAGAAVRARTAARIPGIRSLERIEVAVGTVGLPGNRAAGRPDRMPGGGGADLVVEAHDRGA